MSPKTRDFLDILSLEQVLQTIPSGLFLVDREQRVVYWNAEAERITGYPAAEAVGKHCSFLEGIPCGRGCGLFNEAIPKPIIGISCSVKTRSGRRLALLKNVDYLRDADGHVVGGVESFIDVTPQQQLERRLRRHGVELEHTVRKRTAELEQERTQLRNLLDAMADFAYICSADHRIRFMNRSMIEAFGDHVGKRCHEAFSGQLSPCTACPMEGVLEGEPFRREHHLEATGRTYEVLNTPLRAADGSPQKLAVFRDVTERKEAEEKLLEANRELDAFVSTVSHDLRTPLTPIIGFAEFLREQYGEQLDGQGLDVLNEIEKQAIRMLAVLEDLLALARVGSVEPPSAPVEVESVVRQVLEELTEEIRNNGATVEVGVLPPLAVPATFLAQLFANLIGNALRYDGGSESRIEVGGGEEPGRRRYFVRDHGPGIPAAERTRIFEPFYRGSTAGKTPGTGIGLATVRKIVRLYEGRVWVEETPGGGSTFWMEFPAPGGSGG